MADHPARQSREFWKPKNREYQIDLLDLGGECVTWHPDPGNEGAPHPHDSNQLANMRSDCSILGAAAVDYAPDRYRT